MQKIGDIPNTRADINGEFTDGNVAGGVPPTILPAEWFNTLQRELMSVLSAADIEADSEQFNQVAAAISKLISNGIEGSDFLQAANHLKEIKNAGAAAVAETLANLGLGDGSLIPIGVPLPYPLSAAPTGWLKCNGSTFSTTTYPKLALVYPSGVLPDMRGNAIRGWDDGRGVDTGRALLSEQADAIQNITGSIWVASSPSSSTFTTGAFTSSTPQGVAVTSVWQTLPIQRFDLDASHVARTAAETRMRNIAFNHIVRAA
ncbi:putative bacteriophage tail fiber protein [Yersinia mollaretii]|uniref:phage tail protein n=1 Tax=Yersinia mollaretii TaxID=33060 RepID=UPI0005E9FA2A|nr:phage tail protein [Yersinia mollaretii]CNK04054.1 putative bacteriophage tail fiber protein [Yersinia mollaretii]